MNQLGGRVRRVERGAAAIEFALIMPILMALIFAIIDYGLWFNDSLNVRQGVREAAREAVVDTFPLPACGGATNDMDKLKCITKKQVGALSGTTYVDVVTPNGWVRGKPLVVCVMVKSTGVTGMVPLPSNRVIASKTQMSIEDDTMAPSGTPSADVLPSGFGADWSWCS